MKNENRVNDLNDLVVCKQTTTINHSEIGNKERSFPFQYIVHQWKTNIRVLQTVGVLLISMFISMFSFSQPIDLGKAENFVLYTSSGAIDNTGSSFVNGSMGTDLGAVTGFETSTVSGSTEIANAATEVAVDDVQSAYDQGAAMTATLSPDHAPAFGNGDTLLAGVYNVDGAGSLGGILYLDAKGDPSSVFVLRFGGAFSTGASSKVILINEAKAANVFWLSAGAMSMAANTEMKGILISLNGAVSMGANVKLEGRMFTTTGAIALDKGDVSSPGAFASLPISLLSFTGERNEQNVVLKWSTASETNNDFFTIEQSSDGENWNIIGTVNGAGNSTSQLNYTLTDRTHIEEVSYYRLKQTDFNGEYTYEDIVSIKKYESLKEESLTIYPNPSKGQFEILFDGNSSDINSIIIFDSRSQKIYSSNSYESKFDLSNNVPGLYFMHVQYDSKVLTSKLVISE